MADLKFSEFLTSNDVDPVQVAGIQTGINTLTPLGDVVGNMGYETIVTGMFNTDQAPGAIDTPKLIDFNETGSAITSADGSVSINTDGSVSLVTSQLLVAQIKLQIGRAGAAGRVDFITFTTVEIMGTETVLGEPIHMEFDSDNFNGQKDITRILQAPANSIVRFYWYNDSNEGGNNEGTLQAYTCTSGVGPGGADLPLVPSASLVIGRYVSGVK